MQYVLFTGGNGYTSVYLFETPEQLAELLAGFNIAEGEYAVFSDLSALPSGWENWGYGVTFAATPTPVYSYDFSLAQAQAKELVSFEYTSLSNNTLTLVPPIVLTTQMALPEGERMPIVNQRVNDLNALAADLQATYDLIDSATTLDELDAIVNRDPTVISGTILIDRDGDTLDSASFSSLVGVLPTATQLYFPGTDTTLSYDVGLGVFTSSGLDVFDKDYICILRYSGGNIATFTVTSESQMSFSFTYTPPTP